MERELIVNSSAQGVEIALLEDKNLVELHREAEDNEFTVGNIYIGRVRKLNPGLNAAFVDLGSNDKDAFLHYTDLGPNFRSLSTFTHQALKGQTQDPILKDFKLEPEIIKTGKINQVLNRHQPILVQIFKEPISTKGPRLSCAISLPGRYLVVTPFNPTIGISRRIVSADERKRLQRLMESILPKNFGVIVRTVAEDKSVSVLHEDLTDLVEQWKQIVASMNRSKVPKLVFRESKKTNTLLRDMLNHSFNKIVINDPALFTETKNYIKKISPEKEKIVQFHNSPKSIFSANGVTRQIKSLFGRSVSLNSGAYLVIEHTEALHVVDINSGPKVSKSSNQEEAAYQVNKESAEELARQLRLRDLGGIIIVDFIDMRNPENKKKLYKIMKDAMKDDRAKHSILPVSKFGLMQITRQRVRPEINIATAEVCSNCGGTGKVEATLPIIDLIQNRLEHIIQSGDRKNICLTVHPFIESFLKKGFVSQQIKWFFEYKQWIKVKPNSDYQLTQIMFTDKLGEEIIID